MSPEVVNLQDGARDVVGAPPVNLQRIGEIRTVEVMETELDDLEGAAGATLHAASFFWACLGCFVGGLFSVLGMSAEASVTMVAVAYALLFVTGLGALFFGTTWYREAKKRRGVVSRIRSRLKVAAAP